MVEISPLLTLRSARLSLTSHYGLWQDSTQEGTVLHMNCLHRRKLIVYAALSEE